jgi:hypothetical protein
MTTLPTCDLIPLPHLPRELSEIVEPGQNIAGSRKIYTRVSNGELSMIVFDNGRWKCPRPKLRELAEALGLRLKPSSLRPAAELAAKPEPASKPARPRASTRRSAA